MFLILPSVQPWWGSGFAVLLSCLDCVKHTRMTEWCWLSKLSPFDSKISSIAQQKPVKHAAEKSAKALFYSATLPVQRIFAETLMSNSNASCPIAGESHTATPDTLQMWKQWERKGNTREWKGREWVRETALGWMGANNKHSFFFSPYYSQDLIRPPQSGRSLQSYGVSWTLQKLPISKYSYRFKCT